MKAIQAEHVGQRAPRLLILEDEEAVAYPMAQFFRGRGFHVDAASEAEEADALISHRQYDLAILDLRLGGLSGTEGLDVLREIRHRSPGTAVILLSAHVSREVEEEALRFGADSVLSKPQPLAALAERAAALVGSPRG